MPKHLIIDGYNLLALRTVRNAAWQSEAAREVLLRDLAAYRQRKGHALTVVFDGWQLGQSLERHEHRSGVEVIYSKRHERADQVIQRLVREFGSDCAVVSSDHEIANHAAVYGALVMRAQEFSGKLNTASSNIIPHKELDTGEDARTHRGPEKKGNPRKLPKSQRQRFKQLKQF